MAHPERYAALNAFLGGNQIQKLNGVHVMASRDGYAYFRPLLLFHGEALGLDFHQAAGGRTFHLIKLVVDVLDGFLHAGDHGVFEGIHPASCLFDFLAHAPDSFLEFGHFEQLRQETLKSRDGLVQFAGGMDHGISALALAKGDFQVRN